MVRLLRIQNHLFANMISTKLLNSSLRRVNVLTLPGNLTKFIASRTYSHSTLRMAKVPTMEQVEVDESHVKEKLGDIQMTFVKKAEYRNADRAQKHRHFRKKDTITGLICLGIASSIYAYTIIAMKQEDFLDDFESPDPNADFDEQLEEMNRKEK